MTLTAVLSTGESFRALLPSPSLVHVHGLHPLLFPPHPLSRQTTVQLNFAAPKKTQGIPMPHPGGGLDPQTATTIVSTILPTLFRLPFISSEAGAQKERKERPCACKKSECAHSPASNSNISSTNTDDTFSTLPSP